MGGFIGWQLPPLPNVLPKSGVKTDPSRGKQKLGWVRARCEHDPLFFFTSSELIGSCDLSTGSILLLIGHLKKALKKSWNHIVFNHDFDLKTVACSAFITNFFLKSWIQSKVCCPQNICNRENWWLTAHQKIQYALQSMKYFTQTSSKLTSESFPRIFFGLSAYTFDGRIPTSVSLQQQNSFPM